MFAMSGVAALLLWLGPAKLACGNLICMIVPRLYCLSPEFDPVCCSGTSIRRSQRRRRRWNQRLGCGRREMLWATDHVFLPGTLERRRSRRRLFD
jgi:hypothetical protein